MNILKTAAAVIGTVALLAGTASAQDAEMPHGRRALNQLKLEMIEESLDAYPGRCPCPYNTMRNGASCGRRSAYSRPGGRSPLCYVEDIDIDMVREWVRHRRSTAG